MNERDESLRELRGLLARLCNGELDADGYRRIETLVLGNAEARQLYLEYLLLEGELHWAGGTPSMPAPIVLQPGMEAAAAGVSDGSLSAMATNRNAERPTENVQQIRGSMARLRRMPLFVAALAATLLIAAAFVFRPANDGHDVAKQPIAPVGPAAPAVPSVPVDEPRVAIAELRSNEGCVWKGLETEFVGGTQFYSGQKLELTEGVARFTFAKGATVLVESPAKFELVSAISLRLVHGNVAVRANGPIKDFIVLSRDASIVDLGTSFAVHCDENSATEVEVLEGAVKVVPENDPNKGRILEMGESVQVDAAGKTVSPLATLPDDYRFSNLIEQLWSDIRVEAPERAVSLNDNTVEANFTDGGKPGTVDTFYGAKRGEGWLTPWVATGNPKGQILREDASFGLGDPFLRVRFNRSYERAIAREYGPRLEFDPNQPHVISWRWRLDGKAKQFGSDFQDRATFYGNPFFRRNSWPTNSWVISVVGGNEDDRELSQSSTKYLKLKYGTTEDEDEAIAGPRLVHAKRWYFFDNKSEGVSGAVFDKRNMVDTGMKIKIGVLYHFAVAVYPQEARYDAAIRDDEQTVVRTGLAFRSRENVPANVIHFTTHTTDSNDKRSFSLDSVRIHPLVDGGLQQQLKDEDHEGEKAADNGTK